jgi:hypothetical protein
MKSKPPKRPVVASCNIEGGIYEKARQQVTDLTSNDSSEDKDDSQNKGDDQDEARSPVGKSPVCNLDSDVDLESSFLQGMLSDIQMSPTPGRGTTPTAATDSVCEPTEDGQENT